MEWTASLDVVAGYKLPQRGPHTASDLDLRETESTFVSVEEPRLDCDHVGNRMQTP